MPHIGGASNRWLEIPHPGLVQIKVGTVFAPDGRGQVASRGARGEGVQLAQGRIQSASLMGPRLGREELGEGESQQSAEHGCVGQSHKFLPLGGEPAADGGGGNMGEGREVFGIPAPLEQ